MKVLINWLLSALIVLGIAYLFAGVTVSSFITALVVALVLGIINAFIRPVVLFLTLPINILTLGLFTLVVNTGIVLLAAWVVTGFSIASFWWAFAFSVTLSFLNMFLKEK